MEIVIPCGLCSLGVLVGYAIKVDEPIICLLISISSIMWILFLIAITKLS